MTQYHQEALTLAKGSNSLKETLAEFEFTAECQAKELSVLRSEQRGLKEALEQARTEKETLLQRWMEEKSAEADRLNNYNDTQERWQHLAKQMKKQLKKEMRREGVPSALSPTDVRGISNGTDAHQEPTD
ncbi:autophagy-related protein 16-1 [Salarias fasciatus]|uniref:autophagy-related protein 16-1 n=1 Tax=Salarias fasciatus TaxID=181472 RepID=UPI001176AC9B|nr:autophagy-related protein 16-1-like [Salarias fasciatus]